MSAKTMWLVSIFLFLVGTVLSVIGFFVTDSVQLTMITSSWIFIIAGWICYGIGWIVRILKY